MRCPQRTSAGTIRAGFITLMAGGLILAALVTPAAGQESNNPDQLRKMYNDALKELKTSQERKNQLSEENDRLKASIDDLHKQLAAANAKVTALQHEQQEQGDRTFFLRAHHAAWEAFIKQYPDLLARWKAYVEGDYLGPQHRTIDLREDDIPTTEQSATAPTTSPTTEPATAPSTAPNSAPSIAPATVPASPPTPATATAPTAAPTTTAAATPSTDPATKPN